MKFWSARSTGCSDPGRVRSNNEDAIAMDRDAGIFIVCDGMGGAAAGEVASRRTADDVLSFMQQNASAGFRAAIETANHNLFVTAGQESDCNGMGTTIVALKLSGQTASLAHVGDSRCYRLREGVFEQMMQDHSFVFEQVRRGLMTQHEAARSPMRNVITRAVGTSEHVEVDTVEWQLAVGDVYLLASDGLTREVEDDVIADILRAAGEPEKACAALVAAANEAGGHDNISCIVVRVANGAAL